jgi:RNA polymerase sigma-70 factor (ECF subfamily)
MVVFFITSEGKRHSPDGRIRLLTANATVPVPRVIAKGERESPPLTAGTAFRQFAPFAWRALRRLGVAEVDVEDVCQEVFLVVHRKLATFAGRSSVRTWVYGICVRTAADYRKRMRTRSRTLAPASDIEPSVVQTQEEEIAAREARTLLDRVLDELDDDKRAVFVLYEIEELSMSEVATVMQCPLPTAYSRLHAARSEVERAIARIRARSEVR